MTKPTLQSLHRSERLAKSGIIRRFLHQPIRYSWGILLSKLLFPAFKSTSANKADTFFGEKMTVLLPAGLDIYITHAKSHDSEIRLAKWMIRQLQQGQVFIDGGAHFGYFSLLAHALGCKVFAFEPTSETFGILEQNTFGKEIHVQRMGLSDKNGRVEFHTFKGSFSEYNSLEADTYRNEGWFDESLCVKESIQVVRLDDFCSGNGIFPDIIKLDVEGAEDKVIRGCRRLLEEVHPVIIMEYHPGRPEGPHAKAAIMLNDFGYDTHSINAEGCLKPCPDVEAYFNECGIDSDNLVFTK